MASLEALAGGLLWPNELRWTFWQPVHSGPRRSGVHHYELGRKKTAGTCKGARLVLSLLKLTGIRSDAETARPRALEP